MIEFGTGGWRAVIAEDFTKANVRLLAQGLANRMHAEGVAGRGLVLGYDRRFLSDQFCWWAVEVLVANDIPVTVIDRPAPTPMVMWTVRNKQTRYGLAVTASHNPAHYNGIKLFSAGGRDADLETTDAFTREVNALSEAQVRSVASHEVRDHPLITVQTSMNWYIDAIVEHLDLEAIRHAHLKIVLDPMFGVSQTCLQTILVTARCDVQVINERHDALFGGRMPSPSLETLRELRTRVVESSADLGIATDGDADRLGIFDDRGNFLSANQVLVLLYHYLLVTKGWKGPAVRNIATTHLLDRIAERHGQACHEVPVGFKHISAAMDAHDAVIGGESSGGLTVRGHIPGKDGVFAGSLLVEMIAASGRRLSELWDDIEAEYGHLDLVETAFTFRPDRKDELAERLGRDDLPHFDGLEVERISHLDGTKVYFTNGGWLVVRFSGTEPLLRVFAEMPDEAQARRVVDALVAHLQLA